MRRLHSSEEERLGRWVGEVTRRWAASGLPERRRLDLFARLLDHLAEARTRAESIATIIIADPTAFADATAEERSDR